MEEVEKDGVLIKVGAAETNSGKYEVKFRKHTTETSLHIQHLTAVDVHVTT